LFKFIQSSNDLKDLRRRVGVPDEGAHTPTGDVLEALLIQYKKKTGNNPDLSRVKKRVFLVITDGSPSQSVLKSACLWLLNIFSNSGFSGGCYH